MYKKSYKGRVNFVKLCKELLVTNLIAQCVKLCKEWDATSFGEAMYHESDNGHIVIVKLHKECSTTDFNAAWNG